MITSVRRKYMVVIATVVLSLPFAQLPVTTANALLIELPKMLLLLELQ
jgi:hypothetical protein